MVKSLRIVAEVNQPIAIIDLDIEQTQHLEAKYSRDFSAHMVADMSKVKGNQILVVVSNVSESDDGPFGTVDLVHIPRNSLNFHQRIVVDMGYLSGSGEGNLVIEAARVKKEEPGWGLSSPTYVVNSKSWPKR
jgi:hypothetical protein